MCRNNVEGPYYYYSGRGVYDIRHPSDDPTPPSYYVDYLNMDSTRNALGVNLNYTQSNNEVYYAFQQTGDFVYPNFIEDLEMLLNNSVRVSMIYGDADYICNWYTAFLDVPTTKYGRANCKIGLEVKQFHLLSTTHTRRSLQLLGMPHLG